MDTNKVLTEADFKAAFERFGSDKAIHGYASFYAKHMPANPMSILEIGVKEGASIRAWRALYPDALIIGLDLFEEFKMPSDTPNTKYFKGSQTDYWMLERLRKFNPDVIIDDGSHNSRDQMITFFGLFNGKDYFIEDAHCCEEEFYRQGLPYMATAQALFNSPLPVLLNPQFSDDNKIIHIAC